MNGFALLAAVSLAFAVPQAPPAATERYDAWLESAGGPLRFELEIDRRASPARAWLVQDEHRVEIPRVELGERELRLEFPHYDSSIQAALQSDGWTGAWRKRASAERWVELRFHAIPCVDDCTTPGPTDPGWTPLREGRWSAKFASDDQPAVFVTARERDRVRATFLTTTGDYRYLGGSDRGEIVLSTFDGAHAFLFRARRASDTSLEGDFWSGDRWHDTWTATFDPNAALPDPFALTQSNANAKLSDLRFPDAQGRVRSLDDDDLKGRARIIQVFGSWCPNCNDEAPFLAELDRRYRERGLRIVGLAFELTGDFERDAKQVELYRKRHELEYPLLVAGLSDKAKASRSLPMLDKVRAYPTTIFVRKDGSVRAVHQGYSGPATGPEHEQLRADFERLIEELLAGDAGAK